MSVSLVYFESCLSFGNARIPAGSSADTRVKAKKPKNVRCLRVGSIFGEREVPINCSIPLEVQAYGVETGRGC